MQLCRALFRHSHCSSHSSLYHHEHLRWLYLRQLRLKAGLATQAEHFVALFTVEVRMDVGFSYFCRVRAYFTVLSFSTMR